MPPSSWANPLHLPWALASRGVLAGGGPRPDGCLIPCGPSSRVEGRAARCGAGRGAAAPRLALPLPRRRSLLACTRCRFAPYPSLGVNTREARSS